MKQGQVTVKLDLDFIEYTGKEENKEKFFEVFGQKTNIWLEDDIKHFTFDEKNNFTISYGEWKISKITVKVGNFVVFTPANEFYSTDEYFSFAVYTKTKFYEKFGYVT